MHINFDRMGKTTLIIGITGVLYFLLECLGMPAITLVYIFPSWQNQAFDGVDLAWGYIHVIFIFIFGIWCCLYIALTIYDKLIQKVTLCH
jgi:hypothetical protein